MTKKILVLFIFILGIACVADAQWASDPAGVSTTGSVGIGVTSHANIKLRIADSAADTPGTRTQLSFGTTTATWWAFRLNSANDLYLDRQESGWKEGVVFARNGNVGIGVSTPAGRLHVLGGAALIGISTPLASGDSIVAGTGVGVQRFGSAPNITFTAARGTEAAPAAAGQGDETGRLLFRAYDGTAGAPPLSSARIGGVVDGAVSGGVVPQAITFKTGDSSTPAERMRIDSAGRIGIGTSAPMARLQVHSTTDAMNSLIAQSVTTVEANGTQNDAGGEVSAWQTVGSGITNSGSVTGLRAASWSVGAGAVAESVGASITSGIAPSNTASVTNATALRVGVTKAAGTIATGYGMVVTNVEAATGYGVYQQGADDDNVFIGKVRVGSAYTGPEALHVTGSVRVTGEITGATVVNAVYQDIAEWVPAVSDLAPGTVVVLNPERMNEVMPSNGPYDSTVAGVISERPGVLLGVGGAGKEQVATTGRVNVRVDARANPIRIGDLLVTGELPGTAMKSVPMEINGRKFHQPGTIIGKALQPLERGVGEILVLLSMQ